MIDMQLQAFYDIEFMFRHQVVNFRYGTGGAVFDGQHAIFAKAGFHRIEDTFKIAEKHLAGHAENPVTGPGGKGAFYALTGNHCLSGEFQLGIFDIFQNLSGKGCFPGQNAGLIAFANIEKGLIQLIGVNLKFFPRLIHDLLENSLLSSQVQYREVFFRLCAGDLCRNLHAFHKQPDHLVIDIVDSFSQFIQFHTASSFLTFCIADPKPPLLPPLPPQARPWGRYRGHAAP